jgi:O-antigen/teichoic acid export membrane protein
MWITVSTLIIGVCLNIVLIPEYGMAGAAMATSISLTLRNVFISAWLYSIARIHPFSMNLFKPTALSLILVLIVYYLVEYYIENVEIWMLPLFLALFVSTYGVCIVVTRSFDKEDLVMLLAIERKLGINLTPVKTILKRYI